MIYQVEFDENEQRLIELCAELESVTASEIIRRSVMEHIEDRIDIGVCLKALKGFEEDPRTFSHEGIGKELGFLRPSLLSIPDPRYPWYASQRHPVLLTSGVRAR